MLYMTVYVVRPGSCVNNFAIETAEINIEVKHHLQAQHVAWPGRRALRRGTAEVPREVREAVKYLMPEYYGTSFRQRTGMAVPRFACSMLRPPSPQVLIDSFHTWSLEWYDVVLQKYAEASMRECLPVSNTVTPLGFAANPYLSIPLPAFSGLAQNSQVLHPSVAFSTLASEYVPPTE